MKKCTLYLLTVSYEAHLHLQNSLLGSGVDSTIVKTGLSVLNASWPFKREDCAQRRIMRRLSQANQVNLHPFASTAMSQIL